MGRFAADLLYKYIEGKDLNKFKILEEIYSPDAKVTFTIESESIIFPEEITGPIDIAHELSAKFNKAYDNIKTYYLSDVPLELSELVLEKQTWLVLMREVKNNSLRIGAGHYDWRFVKNTAEEYRISKHHIHIGVMLILSGLSLSFLTHLQSKLPYPWVEKEIALMLLSKHKELAEVSNYLKLNG